MIAWLFFIFWIRSNIFRDFSGSRRPIFNCFYIIRFVFSLAFQRRIRNCSTAKNSRRYSEKKLESRKWWLGFSSFFGFVQTYFAISRAVGVRFLIFIIIFVFSLSFQRHIRNCSTAKTCEDIAKRKRKFENDGSAFLLFLDSFKHISRFRGLKAFDFNFWSNH